MDPVSERGNQTSPTSGSLIARWDVDQGLGNQKFYFFLMHNCKTVFAIPQVIDRAEHIGSALLHEGHSHTGDKFIGIFSQNRPEVQQMSSSFALRLHRNHSLFNM